jgi:hypothetical protein
VVKLILFPNLQQAPSGAETSATKRNSGYSVIEVDIDDLMRQRKTILAQGSNPIRCVTTAQVSDALPYNTPKLVAVGPIPPTTGASHDEAQ